MITYSETLIDYFLYPRHSGRLRAPDLVGHVGTLGQGPYMVLYLRVRDDRVIDAKFQAMGCGPTIACGSMLTELIIGRSVEDCLALTPERLCEALGGIPTEKQHAPVLAIAALQDALSSYHTMVSR
jgi:NifU-like protein involved in Fe-S cluster formation